MSLGFQLTLPPITWALVGRMGLTALTEGHSVAMASQSPGVSFGTVPSRAPPRSLRPGKTMMTLEPRPANWFWISCVPPSPSETIVVTATMPMTTPRTVRPERILFFVSVRSASRTRSSRCIGVSLLPVAQAGRLCYGRTSPRRRIQRRDHLVALAQVAADQLGVLVVDDAQRHVH